MRTLIALSSSPWFPETPHTGFASLPPLRALTQPCSLTATDVVRYRPMFYNLSENQG
jgi:hypothetical protein